MTILELKNISFSVNEDKKNILSNISFSINKGDFISLIGSNGSGKTTLSLILSGIKQQSKGEIYFKNKKIFSQDLIGKIGIVFQNPDNQFIGATVKENIAFGLENKNIPQSQMDKIIDSSLLKVDSLILKDRIPSSLSGGEKQIVAIAEQLAFDYEILIFDEPTSLLDPFSKKHLLKLIKEIHKKGKTIIYITQDIDEIIDYKKTIVLESGKLFYKGDINKYLLKQNKFSTFELELSKELNFLNSNFSITSSWKELVLDANKNK